MFCYLNILFFGKVHIKSKVLLSVVYSKMLILAAFIEKGLDNGHCTQCAYFALLFRLLYCIFDGQMRVVYELCFSCQIIIFFILSSSGAYRKYNCYQKLSFHQILTGMGMQTNELTFFVMIYISHIKTHTLNFLL